MGNLSQSFRWKMAVACIVSLAAMAYIDYATGYELVFSAAYLLPVALCAWHFSRRAVMLMSFAAAAACWFIDEIDGHDYSHYLVEYWNTMVCFIISVCTGLILHRLKNTLEERKQMNVELQKALEEVKRSTQEIRKLQDGLQVVCAWTQKIKVGDQWMTPDEFLSKQLHLKISHGMSPEASRKFEEDVKRHSQEMP